MGRNWDTTRKILHARLEQREAEFQESLDAMDSAQISLERIEIVRALAESVDVETRYVAGREGYSEYEEIHGEPGRVVKIGTKFAEVDFGQQGVWKMPIQDIKAVDEEHAPEAEHGSCFFTIGERIA